MHKTDKQMQLCSRCCEVFLNLYDEKKISLSSEGPCQFYLTFMIPSARGNGLLETIEPAATRKNTASRKSSLPTFCLPKSCSPDT